jgi:hypothetical protein
VQSDTGKSARTGAVEATGTPAPASKVDAAEVKVDADPQPAEDSVSRAPVSANSFVAQTLSSTAQVQSGSVATG